MNTFWELLPPSMPDTSFLFEDEQAWGFRGNFDGKTLNLVSKVNEYFKLPSLEEENPSEDIVPLLERALLSLGNPDRASLILPDTIYRMQVLDIDNFPKDQKEIKKVLLWQARRNLAHPSNNLRVRHKILEKEGDFVRIWICAAPEDLLSLFEKSFKQKKCHIGYITSPSLVISEALARKGALETDDIVLIMNVTSKSLTFLFVKNAKPLFFRTKEIRESSDFEERVAQEIKLTLMFQREKLSEKPLKKIIYRVSSPDIHLPFEEFDLMTEIFPVEKVLAFQESPQIPLAAAIPLASSIWEEK